MEGYCAVACLGLPDGRDAEIAGAWLVWYDPAGNDGNGDAAWSHDPADAARFTDREWAELWTAAPANRPLRPDGKPNRPITMLNLLIVPVRPGELPTIPSGPEAVSPEPPTETEAEFRARLDRMVAAAAVRQPAEKSSPSPPPPSEPAPDKPDLSKPGALTESLRAMGLM